MLKATLLMLVLTLMASGCTTRTPVPVTDRMPAPVRAPVVVSAPPPVVRSEAPIAPPTLPAAADVDADGRPLTYTVKRGDTLGKIALDHGIALRDVAAWNNLENPNLLRAGQVLRLRPPAEAEPVASGPQPGDGSGVVTMPLRPPPLIAEVPLTAAARPPPTAGPQGAPLTAPRPSPEVWKTEPKGVRLPYSEQAVAQLQRGAGVPVAQAPAGIGDRTAPAPARAGTATAPVAAPGIPMAPSLATPAAPPPPPTAPVAPALTAPGASPLATPAAPPPLTAAAPPTPAATVSTPVTPSGPPATPAPAIAGSAQAGPASTASNTSPAGSSRPADSDDVDWTWPANGKLIANFSEGGSAKGIDIAGRLGQPVVAGADGRVVYAGSGLRGYGKLIIIKHNKTYLSAYAHNNEILVKEGQQVTRGQKIAEMGNSDADQVKLHFEIRRMGKPVDPAKYLPPG